jgi:hypothetical protein
VYNFADTPPTSQTHIHIYMGSANPPWYAP